ncbi:MAG: hypothetical protein GY903_10790 [Fuerstiella sp.]|nr:hypothetical protein [Fuerstiella sp.]MCP4854966.1 hypothetical protein [Fuerstiella sp.]
MKRFDIRKTITGKSARRRPMPQTVAVAMATEKLQDRVVLSASPGTVIELGDGDVLDADSDDVMTDALTDVRESRISEDLIVVDKSYRVTLAPVEIELGDTVKIDYSSLGLGKAIGVSIDSYAHVDAISGNGKSVITGTNVGGYDFVKVTLYRFEENVSLIERLEKYDMKVRVQTNIVTTLVIPVLVKAPAGTNQPGTSLDPGESIQKGSSGNEKTSDGSGLFDESRSDAVAKADSSSETSSTDDTYKKTDAVFSDDGLFDKLAASVDDGKMTLRSPDTTDGMKEQDDLLSAGLDVPGSRLW